MAFSIRAQVSRAFRRPWLIALAAGLLWIALSSAFGNAASNAALQIGSAALAAVVAGSRLRRSARPLVWCALSAALVLVAAAQGVRYGQVLAGATPAPPSAADLLSFAGYPFLLSALLVPTVGRGARGAALIDTAAIAAAVGLAAFILLVDPYLEAASLPAAAQATRIGYVGFDVALLAVAARFLAVSGPLSPSRLLLGLGALAYLFSDVAWSWLSLAGTYLPGAWPDTGWALAAVLLATAALHPSMREVGAAGDKSEARLRWWGAALLATALLAAPLSLAAHSYFLGHAIDPLELLVALIGGTSLAALVFVRLVRLIRESQAFADAMDARNEELRELDRLKDELVASVSHELRTPLTSMRGYLGLLLEGDAGEPTGEQRQALEVIGRNSDRLLHVIEDLLLVAQIQAGTLLLERDELDVAAIVGESVNAALPAARAKDVELTVSAEPVRAPVDRTRLSQVIDNLVSNAVKFTPSGGRVRVCVSARDGRALVEVSDSGIGIPAAEQARLFERFFRATTAAAHAVPGTGLGLYLTKKIVEAHGGTIGVDSEEGRGTTFRVDLPSAGREGQEAKTLVTLRAA